MDFWHDVLDLLCFEPVSFSCFNLSTAMKFSNNGNFFLVAFVVLDFTKSKLLVTAEHVSGLSIDILGVCNWQLASMLLRMSVIYPRLVRFELESVAYLVDAPPSYRLAALAILC